jgi:hypothetical protein
VARPEVGRDEISLIDVSQLVAEPPVVRVTVLERNGGDDGTRTRGLCRDSSSMAKKPPDNE